MVDISCNYNMILEIINDIVEISLVNYMNNSSDSISEYKKQRENNHDDTNPTSLISWEVISISNRANSYHNIVKCIEKPQLLVISRETSTQRLSKNDEPSSNKQSHEEPENAT